MFLLLLLSIFRSNTKLVLNFSSLKKKNSGGIVKVDNAMQL